MFEKFFKPSSVAIVGASTEAGKIGNTILGNVIESKFTGTIYPINPKAQEIMGLKAYPTLSAVPGKVDLVVICIPPQHICGVLDEMGRMKIDSTVIITAGFKEVNEEGAKLEQQVKEKIKQLGIRAIGPNCVGIISTEVNMNVTFASKLAQARRGNIGFFSQSGALCVAILDWAVNEGIGFSKFVSFGNKVDINEIDMLRALGDDPETKVILGYVESVDNGVEFLKVAKEVSKKKPIVFMKAGRTERGAKAASSHTGALAGSEQAYVAAFKQAGIIRAYTLTELFDYAIAFSYCNMPEGNRVGILTNSGGPGIIATDCVENSMLKMAVLEKSTIDTLKSKLPPTAAPYNPVDIIGDGDYTRYQLALDHLYQDPNVDSVMVLLTPTATARSHEVAQVVLNVAKKTKKPVTASFMGGPSVAPGLKILSDNKVPHYPFPERAISSIEKLFSYSTLKKRDHTAPKQFSVDINKAREIINSSMKNGVYELGEIEARTVIEAYGFRVPKNTLATSADQASKLASEIGFPVVMKIVSPEILHKSDVGGVKVGVSSAKEAADAYTAIVESAKKHVPNAKIRGVAVQEMVKGGREVILGMKRDAQFGPMVMFGLGGIYVEVLKDVSFRIAPFGVEDAREMVEEIKTSRLLKGFRGDKPVDMDALVENMLRLSQLVCDFPMITELDINPLLLFPQGTKPIALDARLSLAKPK